MIIGRETKENIYIFKDMHKELELYEQDATPINQSYKTLKVHQKGDMSAQWNLTKKWRTAKMLFICLCYALKSKMVHVSVDPPCDDCAERLPSAPDMACDHHGFGQGELLKSYHQKAQQIVASLAKELTPPKRDRCHLYLSKK
jgi:hypothetical protein